MVRSERTTDKHMNTPIRVFTKVSQADLTAERFSVWLQNRHPKQRVKISDLFLTWLKSQINVPLVPLVPFDEGYSLLLLYEQPVVLGEPAWFSYLQAKFKFLRPPRPTPSSDESEEEEAEVSFRFLQESLDVIHEKEAHLRLELAQLCNRTNFLAYCREHVSQGLIDDQRRYCGPLTVWEFVLDYALRTFKPFERLDFYQDQLVLDDECYHAQIAYPAWIDAADSTLAKKDPDQYCYGDILAALEKASAAVAAAEKEGA